MEFRIQFFSAAVLSLLVFAASSTTPNITVELKKYQEFSIFNKFLSLTSVAMDINSRSSLTILAVDDSVLNPVVNRFGGNLPDGLIGDILRYHVLLQYLEVSEIRTITNATGILITTLYQTTGRASSNDGFLNVTTSKSGEIGFGLPSGGGPPNATLVKGVITFPYNLSIFQINHVLIPIGVSNAGASQIDIINVLQKAGRFNTLVSLLKNSGVGAELKSKETGSGITVLAPTDDAFNALPSDALAKLTDDQKATILNYHILSRYFTLGSMQTVSNSAVPTQASGSNGGKYTLGISSVKGIVVIDTSITKAKITNTLYDQPPVSVFSIDTALLPPEIFPASPGATSGPSPLGVPVPVVSPSTEAPISLTPPLAQSPAPVLSPFSVPSLSPVSAPMVSPVPSTLVSSPPTPPPSDVTPNFGPEFAPSPVNTNAGEALLNFLRFHYMILSAMASATLLLW